MVRSFCDGCKKSVSGNFAQLGWGILPGMGDRGGRKGRWRSKVVGADTDFDFDFDFDFDPDSDNDLTDWQPLVPVPVPVHEYVLVLVLVLAALSCT